MKCSIRTSLLTTMRAEVLGIHNSPWGGNTGARRQLFARALNIAFQNIILEQVDSHYPYGLSFRTSAFRQVPYDRLVNQN
jgi:hypothetical protein